MNISSNDKDNLTLEEAAREYKTSLSTLRRRIQEKMLPASKPFGKVLIKRRDIELLFKKVPA
jgi:excisionase family DNA binding protein